MGTRNKRLGQEWKGKTLWRDFAWGRLEGLHPCMAQPQLFPQVGPSLPKHNQVILSGEKDTPYSACSPNHGIKPRLIHRAQEMSSNSILPEGISTCSIQIQVGQRNLKTG